MRKTILAAVVLGVAATGVFVWYAFDRARHQLSGALPIPFHGIAVQSVLTDYGRWVWNGDGQALREYQLTRFDVPKWIDSQHHEGNRWIRGPLPKGPQEEALIFAATPVLGSENDGPERDQAAKDFQPEQWTKSDSVYFYFKRLKYVQARNPQEQGDVDSADIWILDAKTYRLYNVSMQM